MNREHFEKIIKNMPEDSVQRACIIVQEYLRYSEVTIDKQNQNLKSKEGCAVTLKEFLEAQKILLAFSYENSDESTIQELFYCENDCLCNNGKGGFCKGEFLSSRYSKQKKLCKYYSDSQYI